MHLNTESEHRALSDAQREERQPGTTGPAFAESDFTAIREWGFNFARLPLSYWILGKPTDWTYIDDEPF